MRRAIAILGLGSRYSYLAATQIPALEEEFGFEFDIWPMHSPDLIGRAHGGASPFEADQLRGQYDLAYRVQDAQRWAAYYGVPYNPPDVPLEMRALAEACWAMEPAARRAKVFAIYDRVFVQGHLPTAPRKRDADAHDAAIRAALDLGVFGVPSFVVDDAVFWGNDRLNLLRAHMQAL